jgi:heme/copper-type cytochrome/quinol oxidase subunit 3
VTTPVLALPPAGHDRPRNLFNLALVLLGAASTMAVGALVAAYFNVRAAAEEWPPEGVELDNYLGTTLLRTMLLSSLVVEWAPSAVKRGVRRQAVAAQIFTIGFGLSFLVLAWYLVTRLEFGPGDHAFGAIFYALLVAGGINVALAVGVIAVTLARTLGRQITTGNHELLRAAAWYWQFAVFTWVVVYSALYLFHNR